MPSIQKIVITLALATSALAAQIVDGQIQQPTTVVTPVPVPVITPLVKQITDGQVQQVATVSKAPVPTVNATTVITPSAPVATFTGAANLLTYGQDAVAAAVGAAALFAVL